jgi:tetratricopeptide (TPR) repeat protein
MTCRRFACPIVLFAFHLTVGPLAAQDALPHRPPDAILEPPSLEEAEHLYRTGKFEAAEDAYQKLEFGAQAPVAFARLARVYLKDKKTEAAYAAVAKAVELAPNLPDTQISLGEMYFRQGKIAEAEVVLVKVINGGSKNARAFLDLAQVSEVASLNRRANRMIDIAHSLDPSDPDVARYSMDTLPPAEETVALRDYLSHETDDDPETRRELGRALAIMEEDPTGSAHQCRIASKLTSTETDLRNLLGDSTHLRGFGLDVRLNGISSRLMLDTGAGGILVTQKIAAKAGLKKSIETEFLGFGDRGPASGYVAYADSIQVGGMEFKDCPVEVVDKGSAVGGEGLIGADVFDRFLIDLDFSYARLRLSPLPPIPGEPETELGLQAGIDATPHFYDRYISPEMKFYSPVFRFDHMLLIPTALNNSVSKLFLIDSGSLTSMISQSAAREVTRVSGDSDTEVYGLNGRVKKVYESGELTLTFGHLKQRNQDMIAFDMTGFSDSAGTEISGTLGFAMLRMLDIKIDYRDGLVHFDFDPRRWK